MNEVSLVLTDDWADWEANFAIPEMNRSNKLKIRTIAIDKNSKVSIGSVRAEFDEVISKDLSLVNVSMPILPGSFSGSDNCYPEIVAPVRRASAA